MTRNTGNTAAPAPQDDSDIAAELLAAFQQLASQRQPQRQTGSTPDRDPWEGVTLDTAGTEALQRIGWLQQGWFIRESRGKEIPARLAKCGPQQPDPRKVASGEFDQQGFRNWQFLGMVCARLSVYGKIHCAHVARLAVATGAEGDFLATPGRFSTKLGTMLKTRSIRTSNGYFEATPAGQQVLHDALAKTADRILKPATAKPAVASK